VPKGGIAKCPLKCVTVDDGAVGVWPEKENVEPQRPSRKQRVRLLGSGSMSSSISLPAKRSGECCKLPRWSALYH